MGETATLRLTKPQDCLDEMRQIPLSMTIPNEKLLTFGYVLTTF